MKSDIEI